MKSIDDRYLRDPEFTRLVDTFYLFYKEAKMTPTEVREAALLAQIKYEMSYPRPITISNDLKMQLQYCVENRRGNETTTP